MGYAVRVRLICCCIIAVSTFGFGARDRARANESGLPDVATIEAHIKAASGPPLANVRQTRSYEQSGLKGTVTTYEIGDDYREVEDYGPFHEEAGDLHGQRWFKNANGESILRQNDPGKAVVDRTEDRVERVSAPVDAFVIDRLNVRGSGTRTFVDPKTWHVVREESISPTIRTITTYDDFRTTGGRTLAWHESSDDGFPNDHREERIVDEKPDAARATDLSIPGGRAFVEFPNGKTQVKLPVRLVGGKWMARANVGTRGLDLILDSGAAGITLDEGVAKSLGLKIYASYENGVNGGRYTERQTIVPEIHVGDLTMHDVAISTIPHIGVDGETYRAVGLLGFDFLADTVCALDYEHATVTATSPDAFVPPNDPKEIVVPVRVGTEQPMADVRIGNAIGERFVIDTGAVGGVMLMDYFVRRYPSVLRESTRVDTSGMRFSGVGGGFDVDTYKFPSVRIGNLDFRDFAAFVVASKRTYGTDLDGLIGPGFLQLFTVTMDYGNSSFYLVPNTLGRQTISVSPRPTASADSKSGR